MLISRENDLQFLLMFAGQKFPTPTPGFGDRVFYETVSGRNCANLGHHVVILLKLYN